MALTMDGLAVGNGIITVENEAQAVARADPAQKNKGGEAAKAAIALLDLQAEMARRSGLLIVDEEGFDTYNRGVHSMLRYHFGFTPSDARYKLDDAVLNEGEGVSFLLAEQNTNVALRYADYGYILESGRVVMDGPAADLREKLQGPVESLVRAAQSAYREGGRSEAALQVDQFERGTIRAVGALMRPALKEAADATGDAAALRRILREVKKLDSRVARLLRRRCQCDSAALLGQRPLRLREGPVLLLHRLRILG